VPTEKEIKRYYQEVWNSKNIQNMVIIKVLLYTGMRVGELVKVKIEDVDLDNGTIKVMNGKGNKDRVVPFPQTFKEVLAMHISAAEKKEWKYLFESVRREHYSERGIRKILMNYTKSAGMDRSISPHKLRHFLFTWMKKQGVDDALIQPYSGHDSRKSLEIYSKLSITDAQNEYNKIINNFPV
jgi:integrase/recombinase XerD